MKLFLISNFEFAFVFFFFILNFFFSHFFFLGRIFLEDLGYHIVHNLNKGLPVTATSLVATLLLIYRTGINYQDLINKVGWLREEVQKRAANIAYEGEKKKTKTKQKKKMGLSCCYFVCLFVYWNLN